MSVPDYVIPAFRKAQALARASEVARLEAPALDVNDDDLPNNLEEIRKVLLRSQNKAGVGLKHADDSDGEQILKKLQQFNHDEEVDEFYQLVNLREEAGYLYGLALGLLLGKGGAR